MRACCAAALFFHNIKTVVQKWVILYRYIGLVKKRDELLTSDLGDRDA
jgi:hypothetical protein